jgi:YggT family protein
MTNHFSEAGVFLIKTLFDLYLLILMVRLILAYVHANYFNPITRMIVTVTQPLVAPLRRIIPNYRRIEFSTLLWIIIFELIKISLLFAITIGLPDFLTLIPIAFIETLKLLLQTFFYAILLQALMSWFQPSETPATQILRQLTSPILYPLQRIIPPVGGFDISPIPALLLLQLCLILLP